MDLLISIQKQYLSKIISGEKLFELRKILPKNYKDIENVFIYESKGSGKILASFKPIFNKIDKEVFWKEHSLNLGVSKAFYDLYYENKEFTISLEIKSLQIFDKPKELKDFGFNYPPQNYYFIKN